jgi:hypothetical protein
LQFHVRGVAVEGGLPHASPRQSLLPGTKVRLYLRTRTPGCCRNLAEPKNSRKALQGREALVLVYNSGQGTTVLPPQATPAGTRPYYPYEPRFHIAIRRQQTTLAQWSLRALRDAKPDDNPAPEFDSRNRISFDKAFSMQTSDQVS